MEEKVQEQVQEVNKLVEYLQGKLPGLMDFGLKLIIAVILFLIGSKVINLIRRLIRKPFERAGMEEGTKNFIDSLLKAFLYIILAACLAVYLGVEGTSIAALIGSLGVGIALALKESLSNIAGGFILLITKPFVAGDYIREDRHGNEGTVSHMDLFYTTLVTSDNRMISIPNGNLSNTSLTNVSRQETRQIRETVGISYQADIKKAKDIVTYILNHEEGVLQTEPAQVYVEQLGECAVILGWSAWCRSNEWLAVKRRIIEHMKYEFDKEDIKIPYQQQCMTRKETQK